MLKATLCVCSAVILAWPGMARAQSQTPVSAPAPVPAGSGPNTRAAAVPPDLVLLKNGGMLRGTISEMVPGGAVTITLPSGETRRLPMAEVTYAGPTDRGATSRRGAGGRTKRSRQKRSGAVGRAAVPKEQVAVSLTADAPGVSFYVRTEEGVQEGSLEASAGTGSYRLLCEAPCTARLELGSNELALSLPGNPPRPASPPIPVSRATASLHGSYESRSALRTAGVLTLVGGTAGSLGLLFAARNDCSGEPNCNTFKIPLLIASGALLVGGAAVGLVLMKHDDTVTVRETVAPRPATPAAPQLTGKRSAPILIGLRGAF